MKLSTHVPKLSTQVPSDVRECLQRWSAHNHSTMTCELIRAVRERAEREQQQGEQAVR
jgi:hypothetical protein